MTAPAGEPLLFRRYLLGQLEEDSSASLLDQVESGLLSDREYAWRIREAEALLIADYIADRLDSAETRAFEEYYMATLAKQERVALFVALANVAARAAAPEQSRPQKTAWLAAAASVIAVAGLSLWWSNQRVQSEVGRSGALAREAANLQTQVSVLRNNRLAVFPLQPPARNSDRPTPLITPPVGASEVTLVIDRDLSGANQPTATVTQIVNGLPQAPLQVEVHAPANQSFALVSLPTSLPPGFYLLRWGGRTWQFDLKLP
jgi:hypothetical protein